MLLKVLGSSSEGNCYLLRADDGETLLIEAGFPLKSIKKAVNYNINDVVGCLVTHEHKDHAAFVGQILNETAMPVYMSDGTRDALEGRNEATGGRNMRRRANVCQEGEKVSIGRFEVIPVEAAIYKDGGKVLLHDAAQPMCYQIYHPELGVLLFATDLYCLPTTAFRGLNVLMVECNYSEDVLKQNLVAGIVNQGRYDRAWVSHMGLQTLCRQLREMDLSDVSSIVLLHASADNGDPENFIRDIVKASGHGACIAEPGLSIHVGIAPF